jgi:hypothetical protein
METPLVVRTVFALHRRWLWLVSAAAIGALLGFAWLNLKRPPVYLSTVSVVPQRARTEVDYDTRIRTVSSDSGGSTAQAPLPSVSAERRLALAQIVRSVQIENAVRTQLGDSLPEPYRAPGSLLALVQGRVLPRSEIISIEVRASTPQLADQIAGTWAQVYERRVNELYGSSAAGPQPFESEVQQARQRYDAADAALTSFLGATPLAENARALESKQRLLRELTALRQAQVSDVHKIAHRLDLLISQAEALQGQLDTAQDNSAAASSATALVLLKTQAFASSMILPAGLQIQLPSTTVTLPPSPSGSTPTTTPFSPESAASSPDSTADLAATSRSLQDWSVPANLQLQVPAAASTATIGQQRADVAATVQALRDWRARLSQYILASTSGGAAPAGGIDSELSSSIAQLEAQTRDLQVQVAQQSSQQRSLQQARDVLWESYSAVLKKAEESRITGLVGSGKEVVVAAQLPAVADSGASVLLIPVGALLGLLVVGVWVFATDVVAPAYLPLRDGVHRTANGATHSHPADDAAVVSGP